MKNNRLITHLNQLRKAKKKAFSAFLTLGYPNLKTTEKLILEFEKAGVDSIELGFPFSDPLADGPTIQQSSEAALKKGVKVSDAFKLVRSLRKKGCEIPIVFFTYLNPVLHFGYRKFVAELKSSGFDALLIPDMPPEEEKELRKECVKKKFPQIFLVAPTSNDDRMKLISRSSEGFIYYVSLRGVTGARKALPSDIRRAVQQLKRHTKKPVMIGFGVSAAKQAKELSRVADGVIVGSAVIEKIKQAKGRTKPVVTFVKQLVRAVKG